MSLCQNKGQCLALMFFLFYVRVFQHFGAGYCPENQSEPINELFSVSIKCVQARLTVVGLL